MYTEKAYLPRSYGISWDNGHGTLILKIQKRHVSKMREIFCNGYFLVNSLLKTYDTPYHFTEFGEPEKPLGFEDQFSWLEENGTNIIYGWKLPAVMRQTKFRCKDCRGKKRRHGIKCYSCHQTGKQLERADNTFFQSGMLTFYVLTKLLSFMISDDRESESPTKERQLVHLEITHTQGLGNCGIWGWVAGEILKRTNTASDEDVMIVRQAMLEAHEAIWLGTHDIREFRFYQYEESKFFLSVPGNAADLGTQGGMNMFYDVSGSEPITCHNIDTRTQQAALIAGMACLSDQAEKWHRKKRET